MPYTKTIQKIVISICYYPQKLFHNLPGDFGYLAILPFREDFSPLKFLYLKDQIAVGRHRPHGFIYQHLKFIDRRS